MDKVGLLILKLVLNISLHHTYSLSFKGDTLSWSYIQTLEKDDSPHYSNNFDSVCKAAPGNASGSAQHVFYVELKHTTILNIKIGDLFSALSHI